MKIRRFQRIELPLRQALPVQGTFLSKREILRIEGEDCDGRLFFADCSPLPGLHGESLDDCEAALAKGVVVEWQSRDPKRPFAHTPFKSLKTALELLHLLPSAREFRLERCDRFQNSQLVVLPEPGQESECLEALDPRRGVLKVKVGRQDIGRERELLQEIVKRVPKASLRLDANTSLSKDAFKVRAQAFRDLPLAYYEEPCSDLALLSELCADFPIALDENLAANRELRRRAVAWVLKPNLYGFTETLEYFAEATSQKKPLVLSNAFESLPTLQTYAWFYGLLVPKAEAFGFGTVDYLMEAPGNWDPGSMDWPSQPGGLL